MSDVHIGTATSEDAWPLAEIFCASFSGGHENLFPEGLPVDLVADLMSFVIKSIPAAIHVAVEDGHVVGYCIAPASMADLWAKAPISPELLNLAKKAVTGEAEISFKQLAVLFGDKLSFLGSFRIPGYKGTAQILSVAVAPGMRGQGLGTRLVQAGLRHLESVGINQVKLEVLSNNEPAKRVYEKLGFREVSDITNSQGRWLVMVKDLGE